MIPHEYNDKDIHLRSAGNNVLQYDPDRVACEADDQLPILSTIGRGPQGDSLDAQFNPNTDDNVKLVVHNETTGEVLSTSKNLSAGYLKISVTDSPTIGEMEGTDVNAPGSGKFVVIQNVRGGTTKTLAQYEIPASERGYSLYALKDEEFDCTLGDVVEVTTNNIRMYTEGDTDNQPEPRMYDVVIGNGFKNYYNDMHDVISTDYFVGVGIIRNFYNSKAVVAIRTKIVFKLPQAIEDRIKYLEDNMPRHVFVDELPDIDEAHLD